MADGGYYAIKGFAYQFDKTIFEILSSPIEDKQFSFEYLQDLNDDYYVMQIKHKEASNYTDTAIREPVVQLIEAFREDPKTQYILYCHFKNTTEQRIRIDEEKINKILATPKGKSKEAKALAKRMSTIDEELRKTFCNSFELIFSASHQSQFESVLNVIKSEFSIQSNDLAEMYYSQLIHGIQQIILREPKPEMRSCSKMQLRELIKKGKNLYFLSAFKEYKGEKEYLRLIKTKTTQLQKNQKNLLAFGAGIKCESLSIGGFLSILCDKYFKKATFQIEPLTVLMPRARIIQVKKELIQSGIQFNDGYEEIEFSESIFLQPPVKAVKIIGGKASDALGKVSFMLRILSIETFAQLSIVQNYQRIYLFDIDEVPTLNGTTVLRIDGLTTRQVAELQLA